MHKYQITMVITVEAQNEVEALRVAKDYETLGMLVREALNVGELKIQPAKL